MAEPIIAYQNRTWEEVLAILQAPTPLARIEYLPIAVRADGDGYTAVAVPYIDARVVQDRLDEAVTAFNWQSKAEVVGGLLMVSIGIRPPGSSEWVWREDTGQDEPLGDSADDDDGIGGGRGVYSRSFKRCGYQWGIGRDVYGMKRRRLPCEGRTIQRSGRDVHIFLRWKTHPNSRGFAEPEPTRQQKPVQAPAEPAATGPAPAVEVKSATGYYKLAKERGFDNSVAAEVALKFYDGDKERTDWASAWEALQREPR